MEIDYNTSDSFIQKREVLMPLVTTKEMFKKAYEGKYAVVAFNVNKDRKSVV